MLNKISIHSLCKVKSHSESMLNSTRHGNQQHLYIPTNSSEDEFINILYDELRRAI